MELPCKLLEQIAFNTRPKIKEHLIYVMDNSTHEEHLSQPLPTNKQFKIDVTFLPGYNGIFNVTNKNKAFNFATSITGKDGFVYTTIPPGAYELESLNDDIKELFIEEE